MSKDEQKNKNEGLGCCIVLLMLVAIIFVPIIVGSISNSIKNSNEEKHETKLIEEGKTKTDNEVINEIVEVLKEKNENKLKEYLAENFTYYDNDNIEHKYISSFLDDLSVYTTSYEIEKRGNSIEDKETYRVYWNVVEENKKKGIDKTNQYYCLQTITIMLKKAVKENEITYEIEKIILKK